MAMRAVPLSADVDAAAWKTDARSFVVGPSAVATSVGEALTGTGAEGDWEAEADVALTDGADDEASPEGTGGNVDRPAGLLVHPATATTSTNGTAANERRICTNPQQVCARTTWPAPRP